jgi:hypothetical protein
MHGGRLLSLRRQWRGFWPSSGTIPFQCFGFHLPEMDTGWVDLFFFSLLLLPPTYSDFVVVFTATLRHESFGYTLNWTH